MVEENLSNGDEERATEQQSNQGQSQDLANGLSVGLWPFLRIEISRVNVNHAHN